MCILLPEKYPPQSALKSVKLQGGSVFMFQITGCIIIIILPYLMYYQHTQL